MSDEFRFDPDSYDQMMADDIPAYAALQAAVAEAAGAGARGGGQLAARLLELGTGTGETAMHVLAAHPGASLIGVDSGDEMLERARTRLPDADLQPARLQDPLPDGPFDLVFSALAVHHLDGPEKASLFARVATALPPAAASCWGT
ncbi:MAG TPA: class I SAM-dependent methyltransferase [Baekduia sp.]|uniref:class I SAM-dependent methyltransferase n=1 Tax=Baekduia sp. TaxID=2600305 RepID=UPI002D7705B9|nr:class I SAM-dependent methyltransferase [Baekduia sp.]HET6505715.1 class I SAM-dependent methyltransferase [Baekduia sp.]